MNTGRVLLAMALMLSPYPALARAAEQGRPYTLSNSEVFSVEAADGHAYTVMVAWPEGEPPASGWPALYVLDGADNFAVAALTARRLARAGRRSGVEPGVIVGIDSGDLSRRVLDYTPPAGHYAIPKGAPAHGLAIGGGDTFMSFLDERVVPQVASQVPIDPERQSLAGHSFGGLLALHALFGGNTHFSRYIAVSPSLWFGDDLATREERAMAVQTTPPSLLITIGEMEAGPDGQSGSTAEALAARLGARGVPAEFIELSGQDHGTTMLAAMGRAIRFAFGEEAN